MITSIIFILLITFAMGLPLSLLIAPKHNIAGRLGISFLLGIGLFTILMYATNLLGLKLTLLNNIFILLAVSVPLIFLQRKNFVNYWKDLKKSVRNSHLDLSEKVILAVIAFLIVSSFIATFYWPVYIWDSLTLYDFRAHLFTQTGFIKSVLDSSFGGYYLGYPLLTSLSHTIVYLAGGSNPQFIYSTFYLSLALGFYGLLREFVSRKQSLLFVLLLLSIPQIFNQSVVAYTNLPYMTFFSLGAIYFFVWDKKRTSGYLAISAILVGLSVWTRSAEPFWMGILGLVIIISIIRKKYLDIATFLLFFFPIQQIWKSTVSIFMPSVTNSTLTEVVVYTSFLSNALDFQRWKDVVSFLYQGVVRVWDPLSFVFILAFAYSIITKRIKDTYLIYAINIVLLITLLVGTFIFSFTFTTWFEIPDSASRMAMIFYPLFVYSLGITATR